MIDGFVLAGGRSRRMGADKARVAWEGRPLALVVADCLRAVCSRVALVRRGVPAVLLMTGHANGGKAQWDNYMGKIYHTPADDLSQAINWDAGARYATLNYRIARAMADAPQRPMWLKGDYFGELFDPAGPRAPATAMGKP